MIVPVGWLENLSIAQEILGGKVSCEEELVSFMACRRRKGFLGKDTMRDRKKIG